LQAKSHHHPLSIELDSDQGTVSKLPLISDHYTSTRVDGTYQDSTMSTSEEFKHHVVQLDGHVSLPTLRFPHTFEKYLHTSPSELASRIASATIAIATTTTFTKENFLSAPSLQLVSCLGAGCDKFDLHAAKESGVTVTNTPAQNTSTVAEHAISLYFAVKRKIVERSHERGRDVEGPGHVHERL
jgi:hypothetical protein